MQSESHLITHVVEVVDQGIALIGILIVLGFVVAGVSLGRWLFGRDVKLGSATMAGFWSVSALLTSAAILFAVSPYFNKTQAVPNSVERTVSVRKVDEPAKDSASDSDNDRVVSSEDTSNDAVKTDESTNTSKTQEKPATELTDRPKAELPAWTQATKTQEGSKTLTTISSGQYTTIEEAEREAFGIAVATVKDDFDRNNSPVVAWKIPTELVMNHCVRLQFDEKIHRDLGPIAADMHRVYLQVELSPETRSKFTDSWESQIVGNRLWALGSVAGLLTLIFGTTSSYFRFNSATNGAYRKRLQLAAASVVAAGGAIAWTFLPPV